MHYSEGDSYVYIMRMFDGAIKVGHAVNIGLRRSELGCREKPAKILHVWKANYWYSRMIEHHAHGTLAPNRCYGLEYYKTSVKNCVKAVEGAIKNTKRNGDKIALKMRVRADCKNITGEPIKRRREMWEEGRKLQLPVKK